jgi:hypothetical protein
MRSVGDQLPASLRETAAGGLAATPTGRDIARRLARCRPGNGINRSGKVPSMAIPDVSLLVFPVTRDIFAARQKVSSQNALHSVSVATSIDNDRIARARW